MTDVVVVGGGLIGLSTAWRLAQRGARVAVLERDRVLGGASRASAAMVAPVGHREPADAPFLRLRMDGAACWPGFAAELHEATGVDPRYRVTGSLVAAYDEAELARLADLHALHGELGIASTLVDRPAATGIQPGLGPGVRGGLWVPGEGCVDPERTATALVAAIQALGGSVHEHRPVTGLLAGGRVTGVSTVDGDLAAPAVVLAAGAWSAALARVPAAPSLRPVKGQSVVVRTDALRTVVRAGVNLVPRGDGRVMLAGTVEDNGDTDTRATVAGLRFVLDEAVRAVPALAAAEVLGTAVGLRPVAVDDAPLLGPGKPAGLFWATGHSYYGVLLGPITADLLSGVVGGDPASLARVAGFGWDRPPTHGQLAHLGH
jgi:glycine oxidase